MPSNKTILITGSSGQLGSEFKTISEKNDALNFIFTDIDELDITNPIEFDKFFSQKDIDFIVNCAAHTNVDKAETEEELAVQINGLAVKNLANMSVKYKIPLVHISTDYVFDGESDQAYSENETVNPTSAYGRSKAAGERYAETAYKYMIIRTSWLYSSFGHNFVKTMLKLGKEKSSINVVSDQIGSPTYAGDLAKAIYDILKLSTEDESNFISGIYHYSNEGSCSWFEFASEIMNMADLSCKVVPILTSDYPTAAKRPKYSLLNKNKIKQVYHIEIPEWKESLKRCLTAMGDAVLL